VRKLLFGLLLLETLFELSYASAGIEDALLAGVERMTYGADFNEE
jgi:hypothetical protein